MGLIMIMYHDKLSKISKQIQKYQVVDRWGWRWMWWDESNIIREAAFSFFFTPKDLGPSNGRVWTCIAGVGSSKYPVLRVQWSLGTLTFLNKSWFFRNKSWARSSFRTGEKDQVSSQKSNFWKCFSWTSHDQFTRFLTVLRSERIS